LAERGVNVVRIFDTDGNKIQEFGSDVFGSLYSIHVAANGHIFTCDIGVYLGKPAAVRVFDSEGNYLTNVGVSSGGYGGYTEPTAVQTDATGYIYIYSGSKVLKFYQTFEFREEYRLNDEARGIQYAGYAFCI